MPDFSSGKYFTPGLLTTKYVQSSATQIKPSVMRTGNGLSGARFLLDVSGKFKALGSAVGIKSSAPGMYLTGVQIELTSVPTTHDGVMLIDLAVL